MEAWIRGSLSWGESCGSGVVLRDPTADFAGLGPVAVALSLVPPPAQGQACPGLGPSWVKPQVEAAQTLRVGSGGSTELWAGVFPLPLRSLLCGECQGQRKTRVGLL